MEILNSITYFLSSIIIYMPEEKNLSGKFEWNQTKNKICLKAIAFSIFKLGPAWNTLSCLFIVFLYERTAFTSDLQNKSCQKFDNMLYWFIWFSKICLITNILAILQFLYSLDWMEYNPSMQYIINFIRNISRIAFKNKNCFKIKCLISFLFWQFFKTWN